MSYSINALLRCYLSSFPVVPLVSLFIPYVKQFSVVLKRSLSSANVVYPLSFKNPSFKI